MALTATVYKATIDVSDLDRGYYANHVLTLARHPSETEERLMLRVLAFCRYAGEHLEFGRGLSSDGEAALWEIDPTGAIATWIDVGIQDVKQVRRAAGRSDRVVLLAYDQARIEPWWQSHSADLNKIKKLTVWTISDEQVHSLAALVSRNMKLAVTIQDGVIWVSNDTQSVEITLNALKTAL